MQRDRTDTYDPSKSGDSSIFEDNESSSRDERSLISSDGTLRKDAIRATSMPVIQRWERDGADGSIRTRLSVFLVVSIAVIFLQQATSFSGLSGTVLNLWAVAAVPTAAVTASVRKTLGDPGRADEIWFNQELLATVGLIVLAVLTKAGHKSAGGRLAWQLLFGEDTPDGMGSSLGSDGSTVDKSSVRELKQVLFFAVVGSALILVFEQVIVGNRWGSLGDSGQSPGGSSFDAFGGFDAFAGLGTVEWFGISAVMVLVGTIVGAVLAVSRP